MTEENRSEEPHLTKGRLEALSDGIFAFAMTLLVIGLNLPDKAAVVQSNPFALHPPSPSIRISFIMSSPS